MARFREFERQRTLDTCVQRRDGGNDGSQGDGQNIQRTTDKTQTTVDGGCKKYIPMRPEHKRRGKTRSDETPVKSPDESLRIKTKHRCSWRCRDTPYRWRGSDSHSHRDTSCVSPKVCPKYRYATIVERAVKPYGADLVRSP